MQLRPLEAPVQRTGTYLDVSFARDEGEIEEVQGLRYAVFAVLTVARLRKFYSDQAKSRLRAKSSSRLSKCSGSSTNSACPASLKSSVRVAGR